jgi:hypothetical protein
VWFDWILSWSSWGLSLLGSAGVLTRPGSWIPTENRIQLSNDSRYLHLVVNGELYAVKKDLLLEVVSGERENLRLFVWRLH